MEVLQIMPSGDIDEASLCYKTDKIPNTLEMH